MRILFIALIALFQFHLAGCAGNMPMTAEEFRQAVPAAMTEKESFEVHRRFKEVVTTFKRKAVKCLDVTVETTSRSPGSYQLIVANWNPTLIVTEKKAELHVQRIFERGVEQVYDEPEQGHFVMVVDITPASRKKTRIDIYRPTRGVDVILKAVKNWVHGKDIGCPDMNKS